MIQFQQLSKLLITHFIIKLILGRGLGNIKDFEIFSILHPR